MDKKVKILFLGEKESGIPVIMASCRRQDMIAEVKTIPTDETIVPEMFGSPDAIVVGNEHGRGLQVMPLVPKHLLDRTIIAWSEYKPGYEREYLPFGPKYFTELVDIGSVVKQMISEPDPPPAA